MGDVTTFLATVGVRTRTVARAQSKLIAALIAIDATPQIALQFTPGDWTRLTALLTLVTLYLQLLMTFRTLAITGHAPVGYSRQRPTEGRYASTFLLSVLATLGVIAGFIALVVPGILLLTLWSLSLPALCAERIGPTEAMRRSWRLVRPRLRQFLLLDLIWYLSFVVLIGIAFVAGELGDDTLLPFIMSAFDLLLSAMLVVGAMLWAVAYAVVVDEEGSKT